MLRKIIERQRRDGSWSVEIKIPKLTDKGKQAIKLRGVPENLNEKEADSIATSLKQMDIEKIPIRGKAKRQMKLPLAKVGKVSTSQGINPDQSDAEFDHNNAKPENQTPGEKVKLGQADLEKIADMVVAKLKGSEPRFTMLP